MLLENQVYNRSICKFVNDKSIQWNDFKNKRFLISGATGLIGATLVNSILVANQKYDINCQLYLLVRNIKKAELLFGKLNNIKYIECKDIKKISPFNEKIGYVVHTVSKTASKDFVELPVETIMTNILGTQNMLEIAKKNHAHKFVYLSTMEVYGVCNDEKKVLESEEIRCRTDETRNSYPLSKMLAENLCNSYSSEFGIDTCILRLTQTFGPGVEYHDGRVFAEFARCIVENRNITLKTQGKTKRSYLYTTDAVSAILKVISSDKHGCEIYNVSNEETYCSIYEIALMLVDLFENKKLCVKIEEQDISELGYAPTLKINMDTNKIKSIGWKPKYTLQDAFVDLVDWMSSVSNDI